MPAETDLVALGARLAGRRVLASVHFGRDPGPAWSAAGLCVRVPLEPLLGPPRAELWTVPGPVTRRHEEGLALAASDGALFGSLEARLDGGGLAAATRDSYERVLAVTDAAGLALARVWCTLPAIHAERPDGSGEPRDSYHVFNLARGEALVARRGDAFEGELCASTAVGSDEAPLTLTFLACAGPTEHVENPRQVSAYRYPARYGPRSPSFARATRVGDALLVSGTASIVGAESAHPGDLAAQLEETLRNLDEVVERGLPGARLAPLRVYLRDPAELDVLAERLGRRFDLEEEVLVLRADVCRAELLVEVEGVARVPGGEGSR